MTKHSLAAGLLLLTATGLLQAGVSCEPSIDASPSSANLIAGGTDLYVTVTIGHGTCDPSEDVDYQGQLDYVMPPGVDGIGDCTGSISGTLEPGSPEIHECALHAASSAATGDQVIVSGSVQGSILEPPAGEPPAGGAGLQLAVIDIVRETDLELTKTGGGDVTPPDTVTHTIGVTNHGPSYATEIIVTDVLDTLPGDVTGPTYGTPSHGNVVSNVWTITELPDGVTATLEVEFEATTGAASGEIHNTATVTGNVENAGSTDLEDDETSTLIPETDIEITSTESIDPVVAGSGTGNLTYVVTAENLGPNDATGVQVGASLTWPAGVSVVSVTPSQGTWSNTWPGTWNIGNLANGASRTLTIVLTVGLAAAEGTDVIDLSAELSSLNEDDTDAGNDSTGQQTSIRWPTATFRVSKEYTTGDGGPVEVTLECDDTSGLLEYDPQSGTTQTSLTVRRFDITGAGTSCAVVEEVPAGYYEVARTADCDVDPVDDQGSYACTITNAPTRATFTVTKDFTDDNPNGVEVTISCNTGLPLDQSKVIDETESVEFVVVEYDAGEMDCDVSEVVPNGYSPAYSADTVDGVADAIGSDDEGCHFAQVQGGEFTCHIVNTPDPVDIDITKEWVFEGSSDPDGIDTRYELTLYCDAEIVDGSTWCSGGENPVGPPQDETWCQNFSGDGPAWFNAEVIPEYPASNCYVVEDLYDDAVEVDNGCGELVVSAGQGDSCTIVNTVFFEGIPTLNPYGLALLALTMLGIGFVGFRRFA